MADEIKLANQLTLDRKIILGYPGGPGVITRVLKSRKRSKISQRKMRHRRRDPQTRECG